MAALYYSPILRSSVSKWRVSYAAVRAAGERPNPILSLNPLYVTTAAAGMSPWFLSAALIQLIETSGKRPYRVARAQYLAEASRLDVLATAWDVVNRVDSLLLDTSAAQLRLTALDQQIAIQRELVDAARKRLGAGLGSSLELAAASAVLTRATLDRQTTVAALTETLHQLAIVVGVPADQLPLQRLSLPSLNRPVPAAFIEQIRRVAPLNRADLLARLADFTASDAGVRLQLAGRVPNVEAGPGFEYDQGDRKWGLSVAVALPIFNRNGGAIGEAVASRRQAADQFSAAQAAVIGEVDRAIAAYDQSMASLRITDQLYAEQADRARAQEILFARGEIDRLELLAARAEFATTTTVRGDAQGTVAKAALAIESAGQLRADGVDPTRNYLAEVTP